MRLSVKGLAGERGGEAVFSGIDFELAAGEALVVSGPNGAGKSTLLRVIAGLLPVAAGRITFEGDAEFAELQSSLHYLGHQNAMKTALTVNENLGFWQKFAGDPHMTIADALDMVGLGEVGSLPYGYLSTGQKRRIAITRLLVNYRPIWLLDEPTAGLDKASEAQFKGLMKAHLEDDGIIIAATHQPLGLEGAKRLEMGKVGEGKPSV